MECQRERHRRNCEDWHKRNPIHEFGTAWERRFDEAKHGNAVSSVAGDFRKTIRAVPCDVVRDEIGGQHAEIIQQLLRFVLRHVRDEMRRQLADFTDKVGHVRGEVQRDEIEIRGPPI